MNTTTTRITKWETKAATCAVAFIERKLDDGRWAITGAIRVILEGGVWRADKTSAVAGAWMPWEPLTEATYQAATPAKRAARAAARGYYGALPARSRRAAAAVA